MGYRIEHDTMGEVRVPEEHWWGAQTQRSLENFAIGIETMPIGIIQAFAVLKSCAAMANFELGKLDEEKKKGYCSFGPKNSGRRIFRGISFEGMADRQWYSEQYEYE